MKAVVEISGSQFEVAKGDEVITPLLNAEPEETLKFDKILLTIDGDKTQVGKPYLKGTVEAELLEHGKDDKVNVFHKKRRKGYRKFRGHRQRFSKVRITDISIGAGGKSETKKTKAKTAKPEIETEEQTNEK